MKVLVGQESADGDTDSTQHEGYQHAPTSAYTVYKEVGADIYEDFHEPCGRKRIKGLSSLQEDWHKAE